MRKILAALAVLLPSFAFANCAGIDQFSAIQRTDPVGYANLISAAGSVKNGQGVMWKVARGNLPASHLVGTNHVVSEVAKTAVTDFKFIVSEARLLLVELTKEEEAKMQLALATDPSLIFDTSGRILVDYLPPDDHELAEEAFAASGLDFNTGSRLSPTFIQILTAIPICAQIAAAKHPELKMDSALMATAVAAGVPIIGLETWERQLAAFSNQPRDDQEMAARISIQLWRNLENNFATVEGMYRRGEIARIWEFSRYISLQVANATTVRKAMAAVQLELLDRRNHEMAEKAASHLQEGGVVIAVGALHLIGDTGLVELLREQGYTVERIN